MKESCSLSAPAACFACLLSSFFFFLFFLSFVFFSSALSCFLFHPLFLSSSPSFYLFLSLSLSSLPGLTKNRKKKSEKNTPFEQMLQAKSIILQSLNNIPCLRQMCLSLWSIHNIEYKHVTVTSPANNIHKCLY